LSNSAEIRVNGVKQRGAAAPGTFAVLTRTWQNGDRVEMHLPQSLRTEAIDESHPKTVARLRGAVLYAELNSTGAFVPFYRVQNESYSIYQQQA
jgi:DUF1680 family protein